jgi:hypothetical protein
MLENAFKCEQCGEVFETVTLFQKHCCGRHPQKFLNGEVCLKLELCFECANQLEKAVRLNADGSSVFLLQLCRSCTLKWT